MLAITNKTKVGGQAVLEGVMMMASDRYAVAVRRPDHSIVIKSQPIGTSWLKTAAKWPLIRGMLALVRNLTIGISALMYSSTESLGEEQELSSRELVSALVGGIGLAVLMFMVLPTLVTGLFKHSTDNALLLNSVEGTLRIGIFLMYVVVISRLEDIRRVFAYHGAEHKVIACYESGQPLTVQNARGFTTLHPRCGTAFLLIVMLTAVVVFSFFGWQSVWMRVVTRVALLPVIAGVSYEIIQLAGRRPDHWLWGRIVLPGLWLQKLTTREPDDEQLEVAIAALQAVLTQAEELNRGC